MANVESLAKLSADAHVDEPHYLWYERLDESNRDFAPRRIESNVEGGWCLIVDGTTMVGATSHLTRLPLASRTG